MSDQPRRLRDLRNTAQVIRQTTSSFAANLFTFLFLSFLVFSFRTVVENKTHSFTSLIDRDPYLRPLLSRLDLSGGRHLRSPRRRPFLHLTRVGTLDDDFFSGDDRTPSGSSGRAPVNGTLVIFSDFNPKFGCSDPVVDNGIRVSQVVGSGVTFAADSISFAGDEGGTESAEEEEKQEDGSFDFESGQGFSTLEFIMKEVEPDRREAAGLFFMVMLLSAAYGWMIFGFLVTYSCVLGIVFVTVVNDLLERFRSSAGVIWDGSRLGLKRFSGFILIRWAIRDASTQLIGLWYFGSIEDRYSFFKIFVRLKLMPFSAASPWIHGYEKETSGFLFTWFLFDTAVTFIFSVAVWAVIVDWRKSGREVVKEGCYLISIMMNQAIRIQCLEAIFCGSYIRWILGGVCGKSFATAFQAVLEVYFMVAWLLFYLAARCREASTNGRRFGRRELEGLIDDGLR